MTGDKTRLAQIQHRRRQDAILAVLDPTRESGLTAMSPDESLALTELLPKTLNALRHAGQTLTRRFDSPEPAIAELLRASEALGAGVWNFLGLGSMDGFFVGNPAGAVLLAWLSSGNDGIAVAAADLSRGRILDVVTDDIEDGSFIEIEDWGVLQ